MSEPSTTHHDWLQQELVAASRRLYRRSQDEQATRRWRRAPRRNVRFALGSTLGVALAAGIAALIVGLGAGAQRAGAEWSRWTAAPTTPAEGQTAAAEEACLAQTPVLFSHGGPEVGSGPWQALVSDTRGPFTFVLLQSSNENAIATCLATSSVASITGVAAGYPGGKPATVPAQQIKLEESGQARFAPSSSSELASSGSSEPKQLDELGHRYSHVSGQVGAEVSAVTLVLSDGERVTPTVTNEWFLAWWPTWVAVAAAEVTTPQGTSTQQFYNPLSQSRALSRSLAPGEIRRIAPKGRHAGSPLSPPA